MAYDEDILQGAEAAKASSGMDTESDTSCADVQSLLNDIGREQGGTESVLFDPDEKGNGDGFDLDREEPNNGCDPQGFSWNDQPRRENLTD